MITNLLETMRLCDPITDLNDIPINHFYFFQYDLTFGRNRTDTSKKGDDDKSTSRIATRYGSSYSAGYQRDSTATGVV